MESSLWTAITAGAASASTHLPASLAAGASASTDLARSIAFVEKPVTTAAAAGIKQAGFLAGVSRFLSKALPITAVTASTLSGATLVNQQGWHALYDTKRGRAAVFGAVGGGLALIPTPATKIAGAGALGLLAANEFGAFDRLN